MQLGYQNMFVVDACGHKGGLVLFWNDSVEVEITRFSDNHIDTTVILDVGSPKWRFTGFYGFPERVRRRTSWQFLRTLSVLSTLPWVIMGDCNDILHQTEKRGRHPHPNWLITGFNEAVADSGLQDLAFEGNQFTWERSRGTPDMVEEKLDRILTTDSWLALFEGARACSLTCPYSDHLPLVLTPVVMANGTRHRRFCFDNAWIREDKCREIITTSWTRTMGQDVLDRIDACGVALGRLMCVKVGSNTSVCVVTTWDSMSILTRRTSSYICSISSMFIGSRGLRSIGIGMGISTPNTSIIV